jgi:uncharacterized cupredoxin-like copper-binding protein
MIGRSATRLVAALGLFALGAALAVLPTAAGSGRHASSTTITVTAGKPTELSVKLSKTSLIPAGAIVFDVWNKGTANHMFKICSTPTTSSSSKSCKGKSTPLIKPGTSVKLTVTLAKGSYEYLGTEPGHATSTATGLIGVAVKAGAAATSTSSSPGTTTSTPTTPSSPGTVTTPITTAPVTTTTATTTTAGGNPPCMIDGTPC